MKSKSLKTLQIIAKVAKNICKIIFICAIVGVSGCLLGPIILYLVDLIFKFNDTSLNEILVANANINLKSLYSYMIVGAIVLSGIGIVTKFAEIYFEHELKEENPFSFKLASELFRLGILIVAIPAASSFLTNKVYQLKIFINEVIPLKIDNAGSLIVGLIVIAMSLVCKYGSELKNNNSNNNASINSGDSEYDYYYDNKDNDDK